MQTTLAEFRTLLGLPAETKCLEFKEALQQFGNDNLMKYVSALGNEGRSRLVLGVKDRPVPREVVGTAAYSDLGWIEKRVFEVLRVRVDAQELQVDGKRVVIVHIPARGQGRLIRYNNVAWMRAGEGTTAMPDERQAEALLEGRGHFLEQVLEDISAQQLDRLLDLAAFYRLRRKPVPESADSQREDLAQRGLLRPDGQRWAIPRMTALLFARNLKEVDLDDFAPRLLKYRGIDRNSIVHDRTGSLGYALAFEGIVQAVSALAPTEERIEGALRREFVNYPEPAVRELIANALFHQDFERGQRPLVEIYEDRLQVWNDGEPPVPSDRVINSRRARNRMLTDAARELKMCEELGSGWPRALKAIEELHLPAPEIRADHGDMKVVLQAWAPFDKQSGPAHVRACYQHACLQRERHQLLTNESLRERFGLEKSKKNTQAVSRIIGAACDQGRIVRVEHGTYAPYWENEIDHPAPR